MIDKINEEWLKMYDIAKQYFIKYGNLNVFINAKDDETNRLYIWLANQRIKYKSNALNPKKVELLEMLSINWNIYDYDIISNLSWNSVLTVPDIPEITEIVDLINNNQDISVTWLQMYECARRFYLQYGNLAVPSRGNYQYQTGKNGKKLWNWISSQRQNYKNRKLSQKQITLLEDIGMIWDVRKYQQKKFMTQEPIELVIADTSEIAVIDTNVNDYEWNLMYSVAREYYLHYGNLDVPGLNNGLYTLGINGEKLWKWLSLQKQKYRNNTLSEEKIKLLEDIGIIWDMQYKYSHFKYK